MDKRIIPGRVVNFHVIDLPGGIGIKYLNHLHTLNSTAYEIFQLCDGNRTIQDIQNEIQDRYPDRKVEEWVEKFVQKLHSVGLVRERNEHDFEHIIRKY